MSYKNSFNSGDFKRVMLNFVVYNVPVFTLTFLTAIAQDIDLKRSILTASITLCTALVDTVRKFLDGEENNNNIEENKL